LNKSLLKCLVCSAEQGVCFVPKRDKIIMRVCVACRQMKPKQELLRVVRTPEKVVEVDFTGKKAGRGVYICLNSECLNQVINGKKLDKALKVRVDSEVYQELKNMIQNEQILVGKWS